PLNQALGGDQTGHGIEHCWMLDCRSAASRRAGCTSSEQIQFDAVCPVNAGGQKWLILIISGSRLSIVIAISLFATVTASAFGERAYII
ncbi:MAG: hypothetical protein WB614_16510, partial [Pseudolabrys sp.]